AIRKEYRPRMEKAKTVEEAREVLRAMLGRLKQSHFSIIPGDAYGAVAGGNEERRHVPGFQVRVVGDDVLVVSVDPDSRAQQLGVKPGWVVLKGHGEELIPQLQKVLKGWKESPRLQRELVVAAMKPLRGKAGEKVPITFRNGDNKEVTLEIPAGVPRGVPI